MSQVCDTLDPNLKCAKFELEVISTNGDSQQLLMKQSDSLQKYIYIPINILGIWYHTFRRYIEV